MFNNQTVWGIINIVANLANENVTSNMFTDSLWIEILNDAMSYIYWFHQWSWTIVEEDVEIKDNQWTLNYLPNQILLVNDWNVKQVNYFTKNSQSEIVVKWDKIYTTSDLNSKTLHIVYRRWFKPYTINDKWAYLDIPFYLNPVLISLMEFMILPIWLAEWAWQLMNNYLKVVKSF